VLPSHPPPPQTQGNPATRPVTTSTVTGARTPQPTPAIDPKKRTVAEKTDIARPDKLKANPIVFRRRT
jgi:collagen type III alpha